MKKLIILILSFCLFLTSCGTSELDSNVSEDTDTENTVVEEISQEQKDKIKSDMKSMKHLTDYDGKNYLNGTICEGGNSYYIISNAYGGCVLMSYDKENGEFSPLCNAEGCSHDNDECEANVGTLNSGLTYNDGKLYWVETDSSSKTNIGTVVYCEDVESTVRTEIKRIRPKENGMMSNSVFYNDKVVYLYGCCSLPDDMFGAITSTTFGVSDVNDEDDIIILDDKQNEILNLKYPSEIKVEIIDNLVYYTVLTRSADHDYGSTIIEIYSLDVDTTQFNKVLRLSSDGGDIPNSYGFGFISENELYFVTSDTNKVCRYDVIEGRYTALYDFNEFNCDIDILGQISSLEFVNGLYCVIVTNDDGGLTVVAKDLEGNVVIETDLDGIVDETKEYAAWFVCRDEENIFLGLTDDNEQEKKRTNIYVAIPLDGSEPKIISEHISSVLH